MFHSKQRNLMKISNLNTFESSPCADSQCISTDPGQPYSYHEHTSHLFVSSQYSHLHHLFLCVCVCLRVRVCVGELCFIIAVFWLFYDFSFPAKLELSATTWEMEPIASFQEIHSYHTAQYHTAVVQHKTPYNAVLYCTIP